jgi:hypothetical protein
MEARVKRFQEITATGRVHTTYMLLLEEMMLFHSLKRCHCAAQARGEAAEWAYEGGWAFK